MEKNDEFIRAFVKEVRAAVPQITDIWYEKDSISDDYYIWHNLSPKVEILYREKIGLLMYEWLYDRGVYNFSFGYSDDNRLKCRLNKFADTYLETICSFLYANRADNHYEFMEDGIALKEIDVAKLNEEGQMLLDWYISEGEQALYSILEKVVFLDDSLITFVDYYEASFRNCIESRNFEALSNYLFGIPEVMKEKFKLYEFIDKN